MKKFLFFVMRLLGRLLHFFFPLTCYFCGKEDFYSKRTGVCKKCGFIDANSHPTSQLASFTTHQTCKVCSSIMLEARCEFCESRNIFFTKLFFIRYRETKEREILHAIKFEEKKFLSNFLRIGLSTILSQLKELNLNGIVFVPSNKSSMKKRPYHVCQPVLDKLSRSLKVPVLKVLQKNSKELQSGKTFFHRFLHARFAFSIQKDFVKKLSGNYLIVDDLFTTGASINECSRILLENGADQVFVLSLLKVK